MGLFATLTRPARGLWLLRRVLAELRAQRRATERIADVLELQQGTAPSVQGQVFRSYSRTRRDLTDQEVKGLTEVSYVEDRVLGVMLAKEEELRALLGRDPSEAEVERAYRGEIE